MLEFRGVSKVYGRSAGRRVEALADLSFEVKPTELVVLVGPGGAGKSTLLRLITGEERPTRGAVLVDGTEVGTLGARRPSAPAARASVWWARVGACFRIARRSAI